MDRRFQAHMEDGHVPYNVNQLGRQRTYLQKIHRPRRFVPYVLLMLVTATFIGYALYQGHHDSGIVTEMVSREVGQNNPDMVNFGDDKLRDIQPIASNTLQKLLLNVAMNDNSNRHDCQVPESKQTFPDVDYSLLGYNILTGFPLAIGHDPGFTYPIFVSDYSSGGMTADCRYSVPRGLIVIPDVSCITSFSSTTVRSKYQLSKSLATSVTASGGGWGVSFSASTGYKESSTEISTGEYVFIYSKASCNYYFSKLIKDKAPAFDDVFLQWGYKLHGTNLSETYFEFFETYGTHFPTEVTYGARYTYKYRMKSTTYETEKTNDVNVEAHASYSGLFSVSGGFSMDKSQQEAASSFSKNVTTTTITVGAPPPANGDANTWASEVKTSPVPTKYKLSSIEDLFSEKYMGNLNINYNAIAGNIRKFKVEYCEYLRVKGRLESCDAVLPGLVLDHTRLFHHYTNIAVASPTECYEYCMGLIDCEATTYCTNCKERTCFLYKNTGYNSDVHYTLSEKEEWQSNVFIEKIQNELEFSNTVIVGAVRGFENTADKMAPLAHCRELCMRDAHCVAFSHCDCPDKTEQCKHYSASHIKGMKKEPGTSTFFMPSHGRKPAQTTSTTTKRTTTTTTTTTTTVQPSTIKPATVTSIPLTKTTN